MSLTHNTTPSALNIESKGVAVVWLADNSLNPLPGGWGFFCT